jgi:hypothetical protein
MNRAKTDAIQDTIDMLFSKGSAHSRQPSIAGVGARAGFKPMSTRFEARADETTRQVREIIDTAANERHAKVAVLRAARLRKEAEDREAAALMPPKKASRSRKSEKVTATSTAD